jgi:ATP-dependent Clp protease ATP-binding subunit ClpC
MPKINVYLPDELAAAVRDAQIPVSAVCQTALERAVRDVSALRGSDAVPGTDEPAYGAFTRFTPRARKATMLAEGVARAHGHNHVGTEHLLLGILEERGNLAIKVLHALEVEPDTVYSEVTVALGPTADRPTAVALNGGAEHDSEGRAGGPGEIGSTNGDGAGKGLPFTPLAKEALEAAAREALALGHNYVGCEHQLLGLVAVEEGLASQVLRRMGVELRTTRRSVVTALSGFIQASEQRTNAIESDALAEIVRRLEALEARLAS